MSEFVLVNPPRAGGRRRKNAGHKMPPRNRAGQFVSKGHKGHKRTRRNVPAAYLPATASALDMVVVPAASIAANPRRRRRRKGGGGGGSFLSHRPRRNPDGGGPFDMVQDALPIAGGFYVGMNLLDRLPGGLGKFAVTPIGTGVAAWAMANYGRRIFGAYAYPMAIGLVIAAAIKAMRGQGMGLGMGDLGELAEASEIEAIHAVELDGIAGYFVPEGVEEAFSAPVRRRLPNLRAARGPNLLTTAENILDPLHILRATLPPGVPPRLWQALKGHQRKSLRLALMGPRQSGILAALRRLAHAKGLLGDLDPSADMSDVSADEMQDLTDGGMAGPGDADDLARELRSMGVQAA